jgi:hypothetical protein
VDIIFLSEKKYEMDHHLLSHEILSVKLGGLANLLVNRYLPSAFSDVERQIIEKNHFLS